MAAPLMSAQRCLVTVVGSHDQVDLAVPAHAPIAEYADLLARLCGQDTDEALPPVWSLALTGTPALPVTTSLADAGIVDGQVLYLRDVLAGEEDEPVVRPVWEIVSDLGQTGPGRRWDTRARGRTAMLLGTCWLLAALTWLAVTGHGGHLVGPLAGVVGIGLAVTARLLRPYPRVLPRGLRVALGSGVVPALVLASILSIPGPHWDGAHLAYGELGALLGLLVALATVPDVRLAAVALLVLLASGVTALVLALGASTAATAGTVVVAGTLFLAVAPQTAGMLTAASWLRMSSPSVQPRADPERLADRVALAHRTLVLLIGAMSAAVAVALLVLTHDATPFSVALAAVATVTLVLRSGTFQFAAEAIGPLLAGLAGSFGLLAALGHWSATRPLVVPLMVLAGVAAVGVGLPVLLWRADARNAGADVRPHRLRALLTACQLALPPLLLGGYGVYQLLWGLGNQI
jgi:type VII secretion integral membrane protein EccD